MKIALMGKDITRLVERVEWSGDKTQAARKLEITALQDDRDERIPVITVDVGYTVQGFSELDELVFEGNIYDVERDREKSSLKMTCYDHLYVLNRSKVTRKFTNALPEDIAAQMCRELGVIIGNFAQTGIPVTFIANEKTGYQIILGAYTEAHKQNGKLYQLIMSGPRLDIIEKGTMLDFKLDSRRNMDGSVYKESITELINQVMVVDDKGNLIEYIKDEDSQTNYSMYQAVYKQQKDKDTRTEAEKLLNKPKREGHVTALGDYSCKTGYSLAIRDSFFTGQFWIKSDTHTFKDTYHEMKLNLEFENIMEEEQVEYERPKVDKKKAKKKRQRKKKESDADQPKEQ